MRPTILIAPTILLAACAGLDERVRASDCKRPSLIAAGQPISMKDADRLNAENRSYRDCVKSYVSREKAIVEKHQAIANAHASAANAASTEFNQYSESLKANLDERKPADTMP